MSSGLERPDLSLEEAAAIVQHFTPGYQVERLLAAGNFGQVFYARDALKEVAIKFVPLEFRQSAKLAKDVLWIGPAASRDWRRLTSRTDLLHHPSLIRIRDFFRYEHRQEESQVAIYGLIYMDYWPWNLRSCVQTLYKEGSLNPKRKRALLLRLGDLLHRLQADTGLLMTDLKPSNILVRECQQGSLSLAIADLGGLHRQGAAAFQRVETTKYYWAPELHEADTNEVDQVALIFSWGMIAYLILTGKNLQTQEGEQPFAGLTDKEETIWPAGMEEELAGCREIVERCLWRDRVRRYQTFAALARALRREESRWQRGRVVAMPDVQEKVWREPLSGLEMIWLPGGTFAMGQLPEEKIPLTQFAGEKRYQSWFQREVPLHEVTVGGFWLARYPVTVGQFRQFVEESHHVSDAEQEGWAFGLAATGWGEWEGVQWRNPGFPQEEEHPVVCVSWFDARCYCQWLQRQTGLPFTLPTEAQWEYACRAGSRTPYAFGEKITAQQANFAASNKGGTTPVGAYPANPFGLYDMHGNVWEWCQDGFDEKFYAKPQATEVDPLCSYGGGFRVRRGGSWHYQAEYLRSAYRGRNYPDSSYADIGFRVALPIK
ncbi:MAG: SUMF1/EgtB/PvdO family nonheme iron enzyme [Magnetococcales bacterium]|nr:SUMF1/EgtB/PvdO family nonheme iron enzyme [Magnetococcales bacterium]NGZ28052.1 SUMF1/EgtB/PvdO family nonheme iron enzyme [Magnetococcales bacterium]